MPEEPGKTFTEAEHVAILTDAVQREVASATKAKDDKIAELEQRIDVLEAEKAAEAQKATEAEQALEEYKTEVETAREIASRMADREAQVRAVASMGDDYFTEARVQRWAEMADDQFEGFLDDLADTTAASLKPEEASQLAGLEGKERRDKVAAILKTKAEKAAAEKGAGGGSGPGVTHVITETAALSGGQTGGEKAEASTALAFLGRKRIPTTPATGTDG